VVKVMVKDGRKISQERVKLGFSTREFGKQIGLACGQISKIETGKRRSIRPSTAKAICLGLNTMFDELFIVEDGKEGENSCRPD
jgi:transcriptional regulator with XRE-family HTH domain